MPEIRRLPVEVGSLSLIFLAFNTSQVVIAGFQPSIVVSRNRIETVYDWSYLFLLHLLWVSLFEA